MATPGVLSLTVSDAQVAALVADLGEIPKGVPKAIVGAINKTLATGRSLVVKRLTKELALKQKVIRDTIGIRKATYDTKRGVITISRKGISLMQFSPIPAVPAYEHKVALIRKLVQKGQGIEKLRLPAGVSVRVRPGKPREILKGTYVAKMRSGHVGVYERRRTGGKRAPRLPIQERFGPTPEGVFSHAPGVAADVMSQLGATLQKNLDSQVDRLLDRKKADRPE